MSTEMIKQLRKLEEWTEPFCSELLWQRIVEVIIFSESECERSQKIKTTLSISEAKILMHWNAKLPRCKLKLNQTDWMVIGKLLKNAEKKIADIAYELKISARTVVKRRVNMMKESSVFFLQPVRDLKQVRGALPCQLLVQCSATEKSMIDHLIISKYGRIFFDLTDSTTYSIFMVICINLAQAQSILKEIQNQECVSLVKMEN